MIELRLRTQVNKVVKLMYLHWKECLDAKQEKQKSSRSFHMNMNIVIRSTIDSDEEKKVIRFTKYGHGKLKMLWVVGLFTRPFMAFGNQVPSLNTQINYIKALHTPHTYSHHTYVDGCILSRYPGSHAKGRISPWS